MNRNYMNGDGKMIIECQGRGTYIMSEHIVSFEVYDTNDLMTAIDANVNSSSDFVSYRLGKFKNREAAAEYLERLADAMRSNAVPMYVFVEAECV